jgi:Zn-finger nucleic acid-binding protein
MEELRYSKLDELLIDLCARCHGIWLDPGEVPRLERLAARVEKPEGRILGAVRRLEDKGYMVLGITARTKG